MTPLPATSPRFRCRLALVAVALLLIVTPARALAQAPALTFTEGDDRPNILWIVCEDLSPILGCYGDDYATTPNLDRFAEQSVRYDRAFASSPVCSPARTGLILGRHAVSVGGNNHRSRPNTDPEFRSYAAHLRDAGYWTSNRTKTDYNSSRIRQITRESWDSTGTWRNRPADTPFMSVINLEQTHASRGMVWPQERFENEVQSSLPPDLVHDPADAPLPPWLPDTDTMRRGVARYYDCATVMDREVGRILKQLADDGLEDDTIVFFYSDHGTGLPRYKQTALDTGLRVPLLIRFPEKWQHLAPAEPGGSTPRLVSFVDFGPTVLRLAGLDVPQTMQGTPFLADDVEPRAIVFGARDRLDEAFDVQRTVTDGRYRYLRNFMPHVPHLQQNNYWRSSEVAEELFAMLRTGALPEASARWFAPKASEELYDLDADPSETINLANDPEHADTLERMRTVLSAEMRRVGDLNIVPESELSARAGDRPLTDLGASELPLERIITAAEAVGLRDASALARLATDGDAAVRWWAAIGLRQVGDVGHPSLRSLLTDEHDLVRGEAALALLALLATDEAAETTLESLLIDATPEVAEYLARMSIYSGEPNKTRAMLDRAAKRRPDFQPIRRARRAIDQIYE